MRAAFAVLALGTAFAADRIPHEGWPLSPKDSVLIDQKHAELCARLPALLDDVARRREAFAAAPEPEAALAAWSAALAPAHAAVREQNQLLADHNARTFELETWLLREAPANAERAAADAPGATADLLAIRARNTGIQVRNGRARTRYVEENRLHQAALAERNRAAEASSGRDVFPFLIAGGALFVVLSVWAVRRTAPPPVAPPKATSGVPAVLGGNISVLRPIGRGGMGEVYEGLDRTLQRRVAVKRLRPELTGSPADLSRLLNEARLVAALKHPNIVAIHSVEKEAGQVFLVFEYVDGPTLAALLSRRRRLPYAEALRVFSCAAAALQAAHARDIVHRDLKPGNIMLDSNGVVKVMDFGLAHEAARVVSRLTSSGGWGTPPYMSPEQELGEVNAGVDLFALSVCLYEMLTGELPFTGPNFLAQKREKVYVPATTAVPGLPKAVDAFFAAALDPDPAKRFPDAATLAAAAAAIA